MAITIQNRPREFYYFTPDSPAIAVYSSYNAAWNPLVYTFTVPSTEILSSLLIRIYEVGSDTLLYESVFRPFRTGDWNVDISTYVKSYLFSAYAPDFTTNDNSEDAGNALNFYITYVQMFEDGSDSLFSSEQTRPITAICSAMQFGDVHGGNMYEYVPFNYDLPEDQKAKFMTASRNPVMWKGWPFTLSFIYSTNILAVEVKKYEVELNTNHVEISDNETLLSQVPAGKVNYLKINEPSNQLTRFIKVYLGTGEELPNEYVDNGYVDDGYVQII